MYSIFLLISTFFVSAVLGASDEFTITLATDSLTKYSYVVYSSESDIFISNSTSETLTGAVQSDGSLLLSDGSFIGISYDYFTLTNNSASYAKSFSIDDDGYLLFNNTKDFLAIPSGTENNNFILASNGASGNAESAVTVELKAMNGSSSVSAYPDSSSTSSSGASSVMCPWLFAVGAAVLGSNW